MRARLLTAMTVVVAGTACGTATAASVPGSSAKLGSALRELRATQQRGGDVARRGGPQLQVTPGERVMVDVTVSGPLGPAVRRLTAAGMQVLATAREPLPTVEGRVPVTDLGAIAALSTVRAVAPVIAGGTDAGSVTSAGDTVHRGPQARALGAGFTGAGVKVGVISDSIDQVAGGVATSQGTGDLPPGARMQVLLDHAGASDEGRAMAEIIYDEAPGVDALIFSSGTATGASGKAASIAGLVAQGVKVIADDIFYISEPFFQDGVVSQAVDAARAAGVAYFASAGNRARQSWEGTYADNGGHHRFSADATPTVQTLTTVPNGSYIQVALQWNEKWGAAATDLDALLVRADGTALPGATSGGQDDNITGGRPSDVVLWQNTSGAAVSVGLRVQRYAGSASPFMKYIARGNFGAFAIGEAATHSDTINPDAASAQGAIAVAAVAAGDPGLDDPESFSSRGPKTRLRDKDGNPLAAPLVLQRPQLAAADGVATTVPGFETFYGTSAATPSAAGIAALALSARPSLTPAQLEALMSDPARSTDCKPLGGARPDGDCGGGFVFADSSVAQALDTTPPLVSPAVTGTPGPNGWYRGDVGVSWAVSDAESVVHDQAGCQPVTVTADTAGRVLTCAPVSIGGAAAPSTLTVRRDTTPPAAPAFTGIAAGIFTAASLPAAGAIGCSSSDATSGVAGCTVTGYDANLGLHLLTATATDNAGLTASSTLLYTVGLADLLPTVQPILDLLSPSTPADPSSAALPALLRPVLSVFTVPASVRRGRPASFTLTLDQPAMVRFTVTRQAAGRRVKGRCVAPSARNRRSAACRRTVKLGSFAEALEAGRQTATFSGRLGGRVLARGAYRITAVLRSAAGTSAPVSRRLIVRG